MDARVTVRRRLEASIGRERTDQVIAHARGVAGRAANASTDLSARQVSYHLAAIREELVRARKGDDDPVLAELKALRRQLNNAHTIPSVPLSLRRRSVEESVEYICDNPRFADVMVGASKSDCLGSALRATTIDGMVCEFGVYKGESLTQIARFFPERTVHGFDSFAGLPESWSGTAKNAGAFDIGGAPPDVPVENVTFHVGFFDTTVPAFAAKHEGPFSFVHLDADLYSSTKTVMDTLFDWFVPGTVIVFDEYFGYHGWQNHEHKAFLELLERSGLGYEAISLGHMNLAVRLVSA